MVANGVLYAPLGFLGVRAFGGNNRLLAAALLALAYAGLLAFTVEFAQLFFPPRTVSQNDLLAECLGSSVGVAAACWLGPWLARWWHAWQDDSAHLARLAWQAYTVGYLLFCFFPFDILLSRQEFADKLASGNQGWLLALPDASFASWLRALMLLAVEAALTAPIGLTLGQSQPPKTALRRGVAFGAAIGLAIEVGQLFIASGVSQGASLLSRAIGVGAGAWLSSQWHIHSINRWRGRLSSHLRWLLPTYLVVLFFAAGWGTHRWLGWNRALMSWEELRFLPFYYHYFTTEAAALTSLGSVVVMYAPLAVLAWARSMGAGAAAVLATMLAGTLETGKLFMAETHPDPTNILLAGVAVYLLTESIARWERWYADARRSAGKQREPEQAESTEHEVRRTPNRSVRPGLVEGQFSPTQGLRRDQPEWRGIYQRFLGRHTEDRSGTDVGPYRRLGLVGVLLAVAWASIGWPAYPGLVLGVVAIAAAATWRWPPALLAILPAAMPVFDLAPWSGRFYLDEFDLLCAACLAVAYAREHPRLLRRHLSGRSLVFLIMLSSLTVAALRTWGGVTTLDMSSFTSYQSPFNGLRILKGALWAWLFVALYRSLIEKQPALARLLHVGFAAGLLLTVLVVLWERMATVGLFDFATAYRVTGPFSTMNKGGAYIECFLAVATAFVVVELANCRQRLQFWAGATLLALAGYAILVTYSRNGYAALAVALAVGVAVAWRTPRRKHAKALPALLTMVLVAVLGGITLSGGYARERLNESEHDLSVRIAHWRAALDLRNDDLATSLLGVGLGRFPELHFWRSRSESRAAAFRLETGDGNPFLRLAPGAAIYIEQIIAPPANKELELTINLRSATIAPKLAVTLCRKTLLTSDECEQVDVQGVKAPGFWQTEYATFPALREPERWLASLLPVKVSLVTPASGPAIDVDNVSLRVHGTNQYLTRNGSFADGMDHWFFATDVDPPWHIHSLPVALLFDLGWLGLYAALAMLGVAVASGLKALRQGQVEGTAAFAGLLAFLASGSLNTLIDEPRFLWLWLVLAWICSWQGKRGKPAATPGPPEPTGKA